MNIFKEFATDKVGYYATGATAKNTPKEKESKKNYSSNKLL
jgi:hypothetical protein